MSGERMSGAGGDEGGGPLVVTSRFEAPLERLRRLEPTVEIAIVDDARTVSEGAARVARALLAGREVRRFRPEQDEGEAWVESALAEGHAVFAQAAGTTRERSDDWLRNIRIALSRLLTLPPASALDGAAAPLEALVLGAGPSLDRTSARLRAAADGRLVIAVGSALVSAQRAGIDPHLTVLIEASDCSAQLAPPAELERTTLVLAQQGHPSHAEIARGNALRLDLVENGWFADWLETGAPLTSGGNAGTTAIALALRLGCSRIVFGGLDYAERFRGERTGGARSSDFEPGAGNRVVSRGLHGGSVMSSELMTSYRVSLERLIAGAIGRGAQFSNAGDEGCALVEGAQPYDAEGRTSPAGHRATEIDGLAGRVDCLLSRREEVSIAELSRRFDSLVEAACGTLRSASADEGRRQTVARLSRAPGSLAHAFAYGHLALGSDADSREILEERAVALAEWAEGMRERLAALA